MTTPSDHLDQFSYLWTNPNGEWVLVRVGTSAADFAIFNTHGVVKLVEDANLHAAICQKMLVAGCRVFEEMPSLRDVEVRHID